MLAIRSWAFSAPGKKVARAGLHREPHRLRIAVLGRHDHRRPERVLLFGQLAEVVVAALRQRHHHDVGHEAQAVQRIGVAVLDVPQLQLVAVLGGELRVEARAKRRLRPAGEQYFQFGSHRQVLLRRAAQHGCMTPSRGTPRLSRRRVVAKSGVVNR